MGFQLPLPFPAPFAEQLFYGARPPQSCPPTSSQKTAGKVRCAACLKLEAKITTPSRVCRQCIQTHGRRTAEVLAQARRDPAFARSCYERLPPSSREQFVRLLGHMPGLVPQESGPGLSKCRSVSTPKAAAR